MSWKSVFEQEYDVAVIGSGYAGFAAALECARRGERVLLVGPTGDLVWESGRAFAVDAGESAVPAWQHLRAEVDRLAGGTSPVLDGALAEIAATAMVRDAGIDVLYYARPVTVARRGEGVDAVVVGTKSGTRTVRARCWIDATERAELVRLVDSEAEAPEPVEVVATAMLQHPAWPVVVADRLTTTAWETERVVEVVSTPEGWTSDLRVAIEEVCAALGDDEAARVCVSHLSFVPLPRYAARTSGPDASGNVVVASVAAAGGSTLADRFDCGIRAARLAEHVRSSDAASAPEPAVPVAEIAGDVVVVGVGTGGVLAAVAAGRLGADVVGVDALAFPGGVGTGAGVHAYWFGAPGGLQTELDEVTHRIMKETGGAFRDGPFNPWAKRRAVEALLGEAGVRVRQEAIAFDVEREGGRVSAVLAATPDGVIRVRGRVFVDGTGDGDLCFLAGAGFDTGRRGDGLLHAYSQSSGRLRLVGGDVRMAVVNFDAGYVDPADVEDLTRARIHGVLLYLIDGAYANLDRPTYIAPAIGLRQGRQVHTDLVMTLDDLIRRRRFPDAVGYLASHVDSHGSDFEFDSDEAVFWLWLNRAWGIGVGCELSYRQLLPVGLDNVIIGSRCLGVSQDAHYAVRMQRDIQRVGEVAGLAAALTTPAGDVRTVDHGRLRELLERSEALGRPPRVLERGFGVAHDPDDAPREQAEFDLGAADEADRDILLERALVALDAGAPGEAIWWLSRHRGAARDAVVARLESGSDATSWLAAGILAMWEDPLARPRLIRALDETEYGFDDDAVRVPAGTGKYVPEEPEPLTFHKLAPNWLTAIALLRRCGDAGTLDAFERLAARTTTLGLSTATSLLLTVEELLERGVLAGQADRCLAFVADIESRPLIGVTDYTSRASGYFAESALRGDPAPVDWADFAETSGAHARQLRNMYVDMRWQVHLVAARIRARLGGPGDPPAADSRAYVRAAFEQADA